jgi:hypothetical protein
VDQSSDQTYWEYEHEANRFAAELLMPGEWVCTQYLTIRDYERTVQKISAACGVSIEAASIRFRELYPRMEEMVLPYDQILGHSIDHPDLGELQSVLARKFSLNPQFVADRMIKALPLKIVYCLEKDDVVVESSCTYDAYTQVLYKGEKFRDAYHHSDKHYVHKSLVGNYHWWKLRDNITFDDGDNRSWRLILDSIAVDLQTEEGVEKFKRSLNGQLSGAHGSMKSKAIEFESADALATRLIHRLDHPYNFNLARHKDFKALVRKRASELFEKQKKNGLK